MDVSKVNSWRVQIRRDRDVGGRYCLALVKCTLALGSCLLSLQAPVDPPKQPMLTLDQLVKSDNDVDSYSADCFNTARWRQQLASMRRSKAA